MKQGTIFDPIICCASKPRGNEIREAVKYQIGKVEIGMPVFMDYIAAVGTADKRRKGLRNSRKIFDDQHRKRTRRRRKRNKRKSKRRNSSRKRYIRVPRDGNKQIRKLER